MNHLDHIEALAARARRAETPKIDVVDRVCRTIRVQQVEEPALLDTPSIAFAGFSLAVTCLAALWFLPVLNTLLDPWAAYMNATWSL